MLHRPKKERRPFVADNDLLRETFTRESGNEAARAAWPPVADSLLAAGDTVAAYRIWLHAHGIDPLTGKMTLDGLVFFDSLLFLANERNQAKRKTRNQLRPRGRRP